MLTVISPTLFAAVRACMHGCVYLYLQTYIKADIFRLLLPPACVCLHISLSAFLTVLSVRPDVIFLSGCGCYRLLTLGLEWSSPSSTRPFNDGSLPAGGLDAARRQLWSLTAVQALSAPRPCVHMASIMKQAAYNCCVEKKWFWSSSTLKQLTCFMSFWRMRVREQQRDWINVCVLYGFTCPRVWESWYKLLLWLL